MDTNARNNHLLDNHAAFSATIANVMRRQPHLIDDTIGAFVPHALETVIPAHKADGRSTMRTWLCRAASNFAKNELTRHCNWRNDSVDAESTDDSGSVLTGHELSSDAPTPLQCLLRMEQEQALVAALATLDNAELQFLALAGKDSIKAAGAAQGMGAVKATRFRKAIMAKVHSRVAELAD